MGFGNLLGTTTSSANVGGLTVWDAAKKPYNSATNKVVFVSHAGRIWESVQVDNNFEPGAIDIATGLVNTAWAERTKDALSHLRNTDSELKRASNGEVLTADQIISELGNKISLLSLLAGLNTTLPGRITIADKVIEAFGKLQYQADLLEDTLDFAGLATRADVRFDRRVQLITVVTENRIGGLSYRLTPNGGVEAALADIGGLNQAISNMTDLQAQNYEISFVITYSAGYNKANVLAKWRYL